MVLGSHNARVNDGALGESFKGNPHPVQIHGKTYNLYDTIGLREHSGGIVGNPKAVQNYYSLMTYLSNAGGVHLLVLVVKCGKFTETAYKYCRLLHNGFCNSNVPIVVVEANCKNYEQRTCTWWISNSPSFIHDRTLFKGHACMSAPRGSGRRNSAYHSGNVVRELPEVVERLIVQHCMVKGWEMV